MPMYLVPCNSGIVLEIEADTPWIALSRAMNVVRDRRKNAEARIQKEKPPYTDTAYIYRTDFCTGEVVEKKTKLKKRNKLKPLL